MSSVNVGALIGTAAGLGVVHVLAGPDHLSAITTLSANVRTRQAFWLGVRWGVGHSIGLLLVGIILIAITVPVKNAEEGGDHHGEDEPMEVPAALGTAFEMLVGVFMLLLGSYGIHRALSRRRAQAKSREEDLQLQEENEGGAGVVVEEERADEEAGTTAGLMIPKEGAGNVSPTRAQLLLSGSISGAGAGVGGEGSSLLLTRDDAPDGGAVDGAGTTITAADGVQAAVTTTSQVDGTMSPSRGESIDADAAASASADDEATPGPPPGRCQCLARISDRLSAGMAALLIGTVHGLAGPGGVLGVIPAVQLRDWKLAILYLGTFCVVSTLTMGTFATVFGTISSKLVDTSAARLQFCIEFFPSCLSIAVGILWLILSPMGKLEEIFG